MAVFVTGSTGYIGAHVVANLLEQHRERLNLLVRAADRQEAEQRLWRALQLHFDFPQFHNHLRERIRVILGDITEAQLGLGPNDYGELVRTTDSVIHCAASLNRKSEKACLNVNLRGALAVMQLAMEARQHHGLRRFSHVSTVAVAGARSHEVVREDEALDWQRSDYDPYARTKKFSEHMLRQLLPDSPITIFRPSIVLGDSRRAETTQFDMVRAFVFLAGLRVLPFRPTDRLDIVPVNFVADAIATLHQKAQTEHDVYHLSSGTASEGYRQLTDTLARARGRMRPLYLPSLERPFSSVVNSLARRRGSLGYGASLMKVFLPYLTYDTVFDNARVTTEMGAVPAPFSSYAPSLLEFATRHHFQYPYREWPAAESVPA